MASNVRVDLLREFHAVWEMVHLVFISRTSEKPFMVEYTGWLNRNFPGWCHSKMSSFLIFKADTSNLIMEIENLINPREDPRYWMIISRLIARLDFRSIMELLNPNENECDRLLCDVLGAAPKTDRHHMGAEFYQQWKSWKADVKFKLDHQLRNCAVSEVEFRSFESVFRHLGGDKDAIAALGLDWKETLASSISFCAPLSKVHEVKNVTKDIFKGDEERKELDVLDQALLAILELDLSLTLKLSSEIDPWLASHLFMLLNESGQTTVELGNRETEKFRVEFLLSCGKNFLGDEETWTLAFCYFEYCKSVGRKAMKDV